MGKLLGVEHDEEIVLDVAQLVEVFISEVRRHGPPEIQVARHSIVEFNQSGQVGEFHRKIEHHSYFFCEESLLSLKFSRFGCNDLNSFCNQKWFILTLLKVSRAWLNWDRLIASSERKLSILICL